jgi:hypothetical protein
VATQTEALNRTDFHNIANTLQRELTRLEGLTAAAAFIKTMGARVQMAEEIENRIRAAQEQEAAEQQARAAGRDQLVADTEAERTRILNEANERARQVGAKARTASAAAQAELDRVNQEITAKQTELTELSARVERVKSLLS